MYPEKSIEITIKNNRYQVKFPNNGQLIDIQAMKNRLANGQYLNFEWNAFDPLMKRAKDSIDMLSTFSILIPDLKKDLNVSTIVALDIEFENELLRAYRDQFLPWFNQWTEILINPQVKEEDLEQGR
jgi:hypothetical protein